MSEFKMTIRKPFGVRLSITEIRSSSTLINRYLNNQLRIEDVTYKEHNEFVVALAHGKYYSDLETYMKYYPMRCYINLFNLMAGVGDLNCINLILRSKKTLRTKDAVESAFSSDNIDIAVKLIRKKFVYKQSSLFKAIYMRRRHELVVHASGTVNNIQLFSSMIHKHFWHLLDWELYDFIRYLKSYYPNLNFTPSLYRRLLRDEKFDTYAYLARDNIHQLVHISYTLWSLIQIHSFKSTLMLNLCLMSNIFPPVETEEKELTYLISIGKFELADVLVRNGMEKRFSVAKYLEYRHYSPINLETINLYLKSENYIICDGILPSE